MSEPVSNRRLTLMQLDSDRREFAEFLSKVGKLGYKDGQDFKQTNLSNPAAWFKGEVANDEKVKKLRDKYRITSWGLESVAVSKNLSLLPGTEVKLKEESKRIGRIVSGPVGENGFSIVLENGQIVTRNKHEFEIIKEDSTEASSSLHFETDSDEISLESEEEKEYNPWTAKSSQKEDYDDEETKMIDENESDVPDHITLDAECTEEDEKNIRYLTGTELSEHSVWETDLTGSTLTIVTKDLDFEDYDMLCRILKEEGYDFTVYKFNTSSEKDTNSEKIKDEGTGLFQADIASDYRPTSEMGVTAEGEVDEKVSDETKEKEKDYLTHRHDVIAKAIDKEIDESVSFKEADKADTSQILNLKGVDFVKVPNSSFIRAIGYDDSLETLYIRFKHGMYEYYDVPESIFEGIIKAESVGEYFHKNIRHKYSYNLAKKYMKRGAKKKAVAENVNEHFANNEPGLMVKGKTPLDNGAIEQWLETSDYVADWNPEGFWFFEEQPETIDALEHALSSEFNREGIEVTFERQDVEVSENSSADMAVMETSLNESLNWTVDDSSADNIVHVANGKNDYVIYNSNNIFYLQVNGSTKTKGTLAVCKAAAEDFEKK